MVNWCWLVGNDWSREWCRGRSICRFGRCHIGNGVSLILDISNISRVGIEDIVGNNLNATIRQSHSITSIGCVTEKL
jgi:hypothetical protein